MSHILICEINILLGIVCMKVKTDAGMILDDFTEGSSIQGRVLGLRQSPEAHQIRVYVENPQMENPQKSADP